MRTGRPSAAVMLSEEESEILARWARRPKSAQAIAQRARIILQCAKGRSNLQIAELERVTRQTVGKWRGRFLKNRLDGLIDEARPGAPRRISDERIEQMLVRTLESMPRDATHWSTRAMAKACGLSQSSVSRIWRAFGLQP